MYVKRRDLGKSEQVLLFENSFWKQLTHSLDIQTLNKHAHQSLISQVVITTITNEYILKLQNHFC